MLEDVREPIDVTAIVIRLYSEVLKKLVGLGLEAYNPVIELDTGSE